MSTRLSERCGLVMQSEIRNMSIECDSVGGINLSQGVCDTEVPEVVRRGAQEAIERGISTYTHYAGIERLREAIAAKQKRFTGMDADPAAEIIVSAGATGALYCACLALLNPGDEVIVLEPFYGYHISTLEAALAVPVHVRTCPPDWALSREAIERAITPRTRGIIVNTPANPSGKVFGRAELEMIGERAEAHDLIIFTDEIYEHFLYDGRTHIAPGSMPGLAERTVTISGLSKTFSVTGWRVGYSICRADWARAIGYFSDLIYVCAPAPLQIGVAEGLLSLGDDYYEALSREYAEKRERICGALDAAGLTPCVPQGAYYVLADISRLPGADSKERAMGLLRETGVACVPGGAFYHDERGESLARFCFAKDDDVLDEACRRLERLAGG